MAKIVKLTSAWQLWRQTLAEYRLHFWRYTIIILIVMVPTTVFNAYSNGDATVAAYGALATLFMNVALIFSIMLPHTKKSAKIKFRDLYYDSSAVLLRYIFVGVVLAVMLIPAALGLGVIGLSGNSTAAPALGELLLLSVIGLIISIPSIYLLIRNGLGMLTVFEDGNWPGQALRRSRELTKGYFWALFKRYLVLGLGLIISILPTSIICIGLFLVTHAQVFLSIYQVANIAILLPLLYIFLLEVKQMLVDNLPAPANK